MAEDQSLSQDIATRQAREMAQKMFTDMMADAQVDIRRMSLEVLWFLPRDFVDMYSELFYRTFAGKDDGGTGQRGSADAEQARVGKASGKGLAGLGGAKRKTFKRYWVIADERAMEIRDRVDKRLRVISRDIRRELEEGAGGEDRAERKARDRARCGSCKRYMEEGWVFCPGCGEKK